MHHIHEGFAFIVIIAVIVAALAVRS